MAAKGKEKKDKKKLPEDANELQKKRNKAQKEERAREKNLQKAKAEKEEQVNAEEKGERKEDKAEPEVGRSPTSKPSDDATKPAAVEEDGKATAPLELAFGVAGPSEMGLPGVGTSIVESGQGEQPMNVG